MSVTDQGSAGMPTPTVSVDDVVRALRKQLSLQGYEFEAYTERYGWRKTDFGLNPANGVGTSRVILGGDVRAVGGFMATETTGTAAASFRLIDGNITAGEVFCRQNLATGATNIVLFPDDGIQCFTGRVLLQIISGNVEGVLYWR